MMRVFIGILLSAVLAGCGQKHEAEQQTGVTDDKPESRVEQRARERWEALVKGDVAAAYEYLSPGARSLLPLDLYKGQLSGSAVRWTGVEIESTSCEGDVCRASVKVVYTYHGLLQQMNDQESSKILRENWIFSDGNWWFVPE